MTNPIVHRLRFDFDVINARVDFKTGIAFCAELVELSFPDLKKQNRLYNWGKQITVPDTVWYDHYDFLVDGVDYIHVTETFAVMSKRMIEVLESVKPFEHVVHPVRFRQTKPAPDGTGVGSEREFYILNVIGELNIFDWEKSEYSEGNVGLVEVTHAVFHEPPGGLPPFFLEENMGGLRFVSDEAKQALEAAGIVGVKFWPPKLP